MPKPDLVALLERLEKANPMAYRHIVALLRIVERYLTGEHR